MACRTPCAATTARALLEYWYKYIAVLVSDFCDKYQYYSLSTLFRFPIRWSSSTPYRLLCCCRLFPPSLRPILRIMRCTMLSTSETTMLLISSVVSPTAQTTPSSLLSKSVACNVALSKPNNFARLAVSVTMYQSEPDTVVETLQLLKPLS